MKTLISSLSTRVLPRDQLMPLMQAWHHKKNKKCVLPWAETLKRLLTRVADNSCTVLFENTSTILITYLDETVKKGMRSPTQLGQKYCGVLTSLLTHLHFTMEDANLQLVELHRLSPLIVAAVIDMIIATHKKGEEVSTAARIFMKLTMVLGHCQEQLLDALLQSRSLIHPNSRHPAIQVPLIRRLFSCVRAGQALAPVLYLKYLLLAKLWLFMTDKKELGKTRMYVAKLLKLPKALPEWAQNEKVPWLVLPQWNTRLIIKNMTLRGALKTFYGERCEAILASQGHQRRKEKSAASHRIQPGTTKYSTSNNGTTQVKTVNRKESFGTQAVQGGKNKGVQHEAETIQVDPHVASKAAVSCIPKTNESVNKQKNKPTKIKADNTKKSFRAQGAKKHKDGKLHQGAQSVAVGKLAASEVPALCGSNTGSNNSVKNHKDKQATKGKVDNSKTPSGPQASGSGAVDIDVQRESQPSDTENQTADKVALSTATKTGRKVRKRKNKRNSSEALAQTEKKRKLQQSVQKEEIQVPVISRNKSSSKTKSGSSKGSGNANVSGKRKTADNSPDSCKPRIAEDESEGSVKGGLAAADDTSLSCGKKTVVKVGRKGGKRKSVEGLVDKVKKKRKTQNQREAEDINTTLLTSGIEKTSSQQKKRNALVKECKKIQNTQIGNSNNDNLLRSEERLKPVSESVCASKVSSEYTEEKLRISRKSGQKKSRKTPENPLVEREEFKDKIRGTSCQFEEACEYSTDAQTLGKSSQNEERDTSGRQKLSKRHQRIRRKCMDFSVTDLEEKRNRENVNSQDSKEVDVNEICDGETVNIRPTKGKVAKTSLRSVNKSQKMQSWNESSAPESDRLHDVSVDRSNTALEESGGEEENVSESCKSDSIEETATGIISVENNLCEEESERDSGSESCQGELVTESRTGKEEEEKEDLCEDDTEKDNSSGSCQDNSITENLGEIWKEDSTEDDNNEEAVLDEQISEEKDACDASSEGCDDFVEGSEQQASHSTHHTPGKDITHTEQELDYSITESDLDEDNIELEVEVIEDNILDPGDSKDLRDEVVSENGSDEVNDGCDALDTDSCGSALGVFDGDDTNATCDTSKTYDNYEENDSDNELTITECTFGKITDSLIKDVKTESIAATDDFSDFISYMNNDDDGSIEILYETETTEQKKLKANRPQDSKTSKTSLDVTVLDSNYEIEPIKDEMTHSGEGNCDILVTPDSDNPCANGGAKNMTDFKKMPIMGETQNSPTRKGGKRKRNRKHSSSLENKAKRTVAVPEDNAKRTVAMPEDNAKRTAAVPEDNAKRTAAMPEENAKRTATVPEDNAKRTAAVPEDNTKRTSAVPEDNAKRTSPVPNPNCDAPKIAATQDPVSKMMNNFYKSKKVMTVIEKEGSNTQKTDSSCGHVTKCPEDGKKIADCRQNGDMEDSLSTQDKPPPDPTADDDDDDKSIEIVDDTFEIESMLNNIVKDTGRLTSLEGVRERLGDDTTLKEEPASNSGQEEEESKEHIDHNSEVSPSSAIKVKPPASENPQSPRFPTPTCDIDNSKSGSPIDDQEETELLESIVKDASQLTGIHELRERVIWNATLRREAVVAGGDSVTDKEGRKTTDIGDILFNSPFTKTEENSKDVPCKEEEEVVPGLLPTCDAVPPEGSDDDTSDKKNHLEDKTDVTDTKKYDADFDTVKTESNANTPSTEVVENSNTKDENVDMVEENQELSGNDCVQDRELTENKAEDLANISSDIKSEENNFVCAREAEATVAASPKPLNDESVKADKSMELSDTNLSLVLETSNTEVESVIEESGDKFTEGADEAYEASSDASEDPAPRTRRRSRSLRKLCAQQELQQASDSDSSPVRSAMWRNPTLDTTNTLKPRRRRSQSCSLESTSLQSETQDTTTHTLQNSVNGTFTVDKDVSFEKTFTVEARKTSHGEASLASEGTEGHSNEGTEGHSNEGTEGHSNEETLLATPNGHSEGGMHSQPDGAVFVEDRKRTPSQGVREPCKSDSKCASPKRESEEGEGEGAPHSPVKDVLADTARNDEASEFALHTSSQTPPHNGQRSTKIIAGKENTSTSDSVSTEPFVALSSPNKISSDEASQAESLGSSKDAAENTSKKSCALHNEVEIPSGKSDILPDDNSAKSQVTLRQNLSLEKEDQNSNSDRNESEGMYHEVFVKFLEKTTTSDNGLPVEDVENRNKSEEMRPETHQCEKAICDDSNQDMSGGYYEGEEVEVLSTSGIEEEDEGVTSETHKDHGAAAKKVDLTISKRSLRSHVCHSGKDGEEESSDSASRESKGSQIPVVKAHCLSEVALSKEVLISPDVSDEECELVSIGMDLNDAKSPIETDTLEDNSASVCLSNLSVQKSSGGINSPHKTIPEEQDESTVPKTLSQLSPKVFGVKRSKTVLSSPSLATPPSSEKPDDRTVHTRRSSRGLAGEGPSSTPQKLDTPKSSKSHMYSSKALRFIQEEDSLESRQEMSNKAASVETKAKERREATSDREDSVSLAGSPNLKSPTSRYTDEDCKGKKVQTSLSRGSSSLRKEQNGGTSFPDECEDSEDLHPLCENSDDQHNTKRSEALRPQLAKTSVPEDLVLRPDTTRQHSHLPPHTEEESSSCEASRDGLTRSRKRLSSSSSSSQSPHPLRRSSRLNKPT